MLQISEYNETQLANMAAVVGKSVDDFLGMLFEIYQDEIDVKEAEQALKEQGGISLAELKAKYAL